MSFTFSSFYRSLSSKFFFLFLFALFFPLHTPCEEASKTDSQQQTTSSGSQDTLTAPSKVDVNPKNRDSEISRRLEKIMQSTGWFENAKVEVREGIVFLQGSTNTEEVKKWAENLARNTQDTVAVVNHIQVKRPSLWEFKPFLVGLKNQWDAILRTIPSIIFGVIVFLITLVISRYAISWAHYFFSHKFPNPLIRKFLALSIGLLVLLLGLYIIFNIMGLTTIAMTIVGGTGLVGIVLGIAFKEITENFLSSLFLSVNNPFQTGDLIEIEGILGYVEKLTFRSTSLIKTDGTYVQIPNSTVYKSNIFNYTSNPGHREDFVIGIGYDDQISLAQEMAMEILKEHPAVLNSPEPLVLVDSLGASVVNLKIYFWIDRTKHSWSKVRSSVMRLVKENFQVNDISMPDDSRERIFPDGITVNLTSDEQPEAKDTSKQPIKPTVILTEASEIKEQLPSSTSQKGNNLLDNE